MGGLREALDEALTTIEQGIARSHRPDREGFLMTSHIRQILAAHSAGPGIQMVDIAAEAREMYGEHADEIAGRKLPEHEWRFELLFSDGARATMHHGATADDVQAYLAMMRNEGRILQSTPAAPAVPQPADGDAFTRGVAAEHAAGHTGIPLEGCADCQQARAAVPQPVDREALAKRLADAITASDLMGCGCCGGVYDYGKYESREDALAAALAALLAGEQEQVESQQ